MVVCVHMVIIIWLGGWRDASTHKNARAGCCVRKLGVQCDCLICINNCLMEEDYEVICVDDSDCAFVDPLLCMLCRFTQNSMLLKFHGSLVMKA